MPAVRWRACVLCVAVAASACATHPAGTNRFVKGRDPGFVDVGGPVATAADTEAVARAVREATAKRAAEPKSSLPVVEGRDPALKEALAALTKAPSAAAHLRVGQAYYRLGIRDLAYDHYSDALVYDRRSAAAFDGRARVWRDWGFVALALGDAHRARHYQPASATVRNTLGTVLELRGLCREALAEYREALRIEPGATWAQQNVTRLTDTCSGATSSTR